MTDEDCLFIADALLALCEKPADRPYYSEEGMRAKLRKAQQREPIYGHLLGGKQDDPILKEECVEVFDLANLTVRQTEVLWMRLEGYTFEEIGKSGGHSKQGAQNIFVQALKKLSRAFRVYPFRGLSDVYREETRRGSMSRPFGTIPVHPRKSA